MYALGAIDEGGFIDAHLKDDVIKTMHRETRLPKDCIPYATLGAAKEAFVNPDESGFILGYNEEGGVQSIWCYQASEEVIQTRLKIWSGCYGTWKVRRLNAPDPAV